jgi:hypothetical protein
MQTLVKVGTLLVALQLSCSSLVCRDDFAIAQTEEKPTPTSVVTAETVSTTNLTIPSLWWVQQQFAATESFGDKLIETWVAYPRPFDKPGTVDFRVNAQLWSLLDYLARYAFIHEFGTAAKLFGYNLRVLDGRNQVLGEYVCNFEAVDLTRLQVKDASANNLQLNQQMTEPVTCEVRSLGTGGKAGLRGKPTNPFGGAAKGLDTEK